ncbi:MAG: Fic family protein [Flavobacteriaceae bacterium]|jgi:Fic family protein|nr:Fic family protein [Flavobacteriaceae bacterium]
MKLEKPPQSKTDKKLIQDLISGKFQEFLENSDNRYWYWDELKYRKNAPYTSQIKNWSLIKLYRNLNCKTLKFGEYQFNYHLTSEIQKGLHEFDLKLVRNLNQNPMLLSDRAEYLKSSFEEAIASSQIEGAATTTEIAKEMLRSGRKPVNESEQMIFNNLKAIQFINENISHKMDFGLIFDIHQIMTVRTKAEKYAGSFRESEVHVVDHTDGEIAHTPPDWEEVELLMTDLCEFINDDGLFIHPVVKASILHFMIGYIHPFLDGNGRTARALFYWYLLKKGYGLVRDISISRVIQGSRTQYDKAFLKTEYDQNDLNYFIYYSIKNLRVAFERLVHYGERKEEERRRANNLAYKLIQKGLNKRQADLLSYFYRKPKNFITVKDYSEKNKIVRQTASKDIRELIKIGLLYESKSIKPARFNLSDIGYLERFADN